ncbi:MAG: molybdenum cofactor guanylyltransferase MobA [Rhodanobacteraceae bacterium]
MSGARTLGVILAGGAGQRVGGADKGQVAIHGGPVVERVAAVLRPQCDEMVIVANRHPSDYARVARVIGDEIPGHAGPLAGIAAALALVVGSKEEEYADCHWLLTVPVDCPDLPADLSQRLHAALDADPAPSCAYARDEHKLQPLFALYSLRHGKTLLESARSNAERHGSVLRWHLELHAQEVDFRDQTAAFHNLNTLGDFREYERTHG